MSVSSLISKGVVGKILFYFCVRVCTSYAVCDHASVCKVEFQANNPSFFFKHCNYMPKSAISLLTNVYSLHLLMRICSTKLRKTE